MAEKRAVEKLPLPSCFMDDEGINACFLGTSFYLFVNVVVFE